jgi:adenine-specific DNA-methyltransferase
MDIEIGDEQFVKEPSVLEELAYRDTWGKGSDSFIAMIYERLQLMKDLLSEDGSIYVHCDYRVNAYMRLVLDEIFGQDYFVNEIIWKRKGGSANPANRLGVVTDTILLFSKTENLNLKPQFTKDSDEAKNIFSKDLITLTKMAENS